MLSKSKTAIGFANLLSKILPDAKNTDCKTCSSNVVLESCMFAVCRWYSFRIWRDVKLDEIYFRLLWQ